MSCAKEHPAVMAPATQRAAEDGYSSSSEKMIFVSANDPALWL
jgi:hypothetical protein